MNGAPGPGNKIDEMLLTIWRKNYPLMMERVRVLQKACDALSSGRLDEETRDDACAAAHKLAGVLGTFGLAEGSGIASQLEASLDAQAAVPQEQTFCASIAKLESMIEAKPR
jgi:HPt (histidine-containing phosphotransfer) domain-containing protein